MFGKSRKLADTVLPDVYEFLDTGVQQETKKLLRRFSSEADGAEKAFHERQKYSIASGAVRKANCFD